RARALYSCTARAASSSPLPLSPTSMTLAVVGPTRRICACTNCIRGDSPNSGIDTAAASAASAPSVFTRYVPLVVARVYFYRVAAYELANIADHRIRQLLV